MNIADFEIGGTYQARKTDFHPPDGSDVIIGKDIRFTVLAPADETNRLVFDGEREEVPTAAEVESWKSFLRVENLGLGNKVHLLHPETLVSAECIN